MARFTNIGLARKTFVQSSAQEQSTQRERERPQDGGWAGRGRGGGAGGRGGRGGRGGSRGGFKKGGNSERGWGRDPDIANRTKFAIERAEHRRNQREQERNMNTTCFACRGTGHAARDCPNILAAAEGASGSAAMLEADELARKAGLIGGEGEEGEKEDAAEEPEQEEETDGKKGKKSKKGKKEKKNDLTGGQITGGKCYRCNSNAHNLHQCPAPVDPENPTPYATCFVCLGSGHLSASCPKNPRGVYVNGGDCKICHSVAHRAKDCPTQRPETTDMPARGARNAVLLGTGEGAGADEDDFMVTRRTATPGEAKGSRPKHLPAKNSARGMAKRPGEEGFYEQQAAPAPKKKKVVSF